MPDLKQILRDKKIIGNEFVNNNCVDYYVSIPAH